jgi:hypothetical protein
MVSMVPPDEAVCICQDLFTEVPSRCQPVEKVGVELVATTNRAPIAPKATCLVPIGVRFEVNAAIKGVFQQPDAFSELRLSYGSAPY